MRQLILTALIAFVVSSINPALAFTEAEVDDALKNCEAAQSTEAPQKKKKKGPLRYALKALANEGAASLSDTGKDMVFVFSCQDIDPYAKKAPKNKPYTQLQVQLVDGSMCSLIRYPDNSGKVKGGFADGSIIAPLGPKTFVIGYPNGTRGRIDMEPGGNYKIFRPDNTVTTFTKEDAGRFSIHNSKFGYMGDAEPDRTGLSYEFKQPN